MTYTCDRTHITFTARKDITIPRPTQARALRDALRRLLVAHGALDESRRPCGAPLSTAHAWALLELREGGAITVSELAERLNIDRTNVSRLTMRMEANGEVTRAPHPADRRARSLTLTAKGARIAQSVNRSSTAHFRGIADHLDWETSEIIDALNSLTSAMSVASGTSASAGARA